MEQILHRYRRLIMFFLCSLVAGSMFYLYQDDYYKWSCEEESNSASCFLVAKKLMLEGDKEFALNYFQRSCSAGYKAACSYLK
jgi:hypothetical protein